MTKKEFNISKHYLTALINNDFSGMTDDEKNQLESFIEHNKLGYAYCPDFDSDDMGFTKCNVSGSYSDCIQLTFETI